MEHSEKETTERSNSYKAIGLTTQSIDLLRTLMLGMISLLIEIHIHKYGW